MQLDTPYTTRSWIRLFYHGRKFPDGFTSFYARVNMHHSLFWKLPGQMQSKNMQRYWRICSVIWQKAYQNLCLKITRYFMAVFQRWLSVSEICWSSRNFLQTLMNVWKDLQKHMKWIKKLCVSIITIRTEYLHNFRNLRKKRFPIRQGKGFNGRNMKFLSRRMK